MDRIKILCKRQINENAVIYNMLYHNYVQINLFVAKKGHIYIHLPPNQWPFNLLTLCAYEKFLLTKGPIRSAINRRSDSKFYGIKIYFAILFPGISIDSANYTRTLFAQNS